MSYFFGRHPLRSRLANLGDIHRVHVVLLDLGGQVHKSRHEALGGNVHDSIPHKIPRKEDKGCARDVERKSKLLAYYVHLVHIVPEDRGLLGQR